MRVRCAFDGAAEIGFRPQRQVADGAFNPFRGRGPTGRCQLGRSNLHGTLKGLIAAHDDLAVNELPADASVLEIVVQLLLERVGPRVFISFGLAAMKSRSPSSFEIVIASAGGGQSSMPYRLNSRSMRSHKNAADE